MWIFYLLTGSARQIDYSGKTALTAFDLGILHKQDLEMGIRESLKLSAYYISIALAFGIWVWLQKGGESGMQIYTGYFIEKAPSFDNVFVISLIYTYSFAIDSVPAIFAITTDTFIVSTSNIMAILGLRALYFALAAIVQRFHYLKYALALVLVFIGAEIFVSDFLIDGD